ncbi:MAG TPA: FAD-dependent oxidoreductase [Planctomycetota bacterium]|nr:FAD-dependent oxidoreductase [Planctomycetota bacterium]HRR78828.1 FAD-dependent oxidoreductase [Planctomycetota bacterium]HRT92866.1 FAD-dependent oxidoreductase [Planctomycetota bacterium]
MIIILGAGLAGLSTAYHLRRAGCRALALHEREERPGGLCRSEARGGFTFDCTGHFLHLRTPEMARLAGRLLGRELATVVRSSWVWSQGVYTRYPFQTNTFGLPIETVKEVLLGYIQAMLDRESRESARMNATRMRSKPQSFEQWIHETFGAGIAKHFMIPYNEKLWGIHPRFLSTEWMGRYVPPAPIEQVIEGALTDKASGEGYNATFRYPRAGGIETLVRALAARAGPIRVGSEAVAIDPRRRRVEFADGSRADYAALVSTLPLPELVARLRPVPDRVRDAAARLRWASLYSVNLGLGRDATDGRQWVYVPERRFPFYRVGCFSNVAASMAPRGGAAVWTEVSYPPARPLDRSRVRRQILDGLREMGWLRRRRDIAIEWQLDIPFAYVIYDAHRRRATETILRHLAKRDIYSIGRYGRWEYSSMEDALLQGRETAQRLLERHET